ncbi:hypothetical protein [Kineococcus rubinsiae]|uniref:hypothetical protein n=1 Tax=Kineococcus rubinsiae TaxID=2609562 RepID=UPI001430B512|nr:hypothetical protein [Kineococcus rubinsiae]NIZ92622.1 hypothetical protein [Kineococcus rubinsiae]
MSSSSRHRAPVRTRRPRTRPRPEHVAERVGLLLAVVCSGLAVLLVVEGLRTPAIAVAAAGLALALAALVLGRTQRSRRA